MKQTEIEAFLAIVECGSFSAAAHQLYVGQPTLSSRIKTLEDELGVTLFQRYRGQKNTELTLQGKLFEPYAHKWKELMSDTTTAMASDGIDSLHIASCHSITSYIIPGVYARLRKTSRSLSFKFSSHHYDEIFHMVESGEADFGFVSNLIYSRTVQVRDLFSEEMVLVVRKNSDYPELVHPKDLDVHKEVHTFWNNEYDKWHSYWIGPVKQTSVQIGDVSLLAHFVQLDDNWAIAPVSIANTICQNSDDFRLCHLTDAPIPRITRLICRSDASDYVVLPEILKEMRSIVTHLGGVWLDDSFEN